MSEVVKLVRSRGPYEDGWNDAMSEVSDYVDRLSDVIAASANWRTRDAAKEIVTLLQTMGRKVREARK